MAGWYSQESVNTYWKSPCSGGHGQGRQANRREEQGSIKPWKNLIALLNDILLGGFTSPRFPTKNTQNGCPSKSHIMNHLGALSNYHFIYCPMTGRLFEINFADLEGPPQVFGKGIANMRVGEGLPHLQIQFQKVCQPSDSKWNGIW